MINNLSLSISRNRSWGLIFAVSSRHYSQDIKIIKNPDLASLKRGTGGRSSFDGNVVTVFGANGFLGRYICSQLGKRGSQLIIPYRCDSDNLSLKSLKLCGDLGQVLFQPFDLKDPLSIRKAVKYSNVVINLIGKTFETRNFKFYDVHIKGAQEIAKACREFNIERLIHFSALNVTENPERLFLNKFQFFPSKLKGEEAVMEEFPDATIFRPAMSYGPTDAFLWSICTKVRRSSGRIPLYAKGKKTVKQPVYASDISLGVVKALSDYNTKGKIYQLVGPQKFYLGDIAYFCAQLMQLKGTQNEIINDIRFDPVFAAKWIFSSVIYFLYGMPNRGLNLEHFELESTTDYVDKNLPTLNDLGVPLTKFEDRVPHIILPTFLDEPDSPRDLNDFVPADSLSPKAITDYSL